ncbi:DUF4832 domain-containing protein [Geodermatophilus sp. CPCC 206100]|uniref:DUF4832 domain-containing protein n=1 Tax=Geodermatophilus sp. CPCC 206100 TaxID=3020054 RepID=UPI003B000C54
MPAPAGSDPSRTVTLLPESPDYLANPGTGYQGWTHDSGALPQSTEYRRGEHPAQGGFDWATLNPGPGVFDWAPIDTFLAECAERGERGSFRVYTMNGAPYGTHRVPPWALDRGVVIRQTAEREPDYRDRDYQRYWGDFVDALAKRYDGDPRIAFIDISGYGLFNEWQANDLTDASDEAGLADSVDSSTRRHLVHMFVGGSGAARVVEQDGVSDGTLLYAHPGFRTTQLLMPYGGIWASSRYVATHYPHVGFRNDALFTRHADLEVLALMGYGVTDIWRTAPVVFEAAGPPPAGAEAAAAQTLRGMGASFLHENAVMTDRSALERLVSPLGYRYHPSRVSSPPSVSTSERLDVETTWTNTGNARAYPRMGQDFVLAYALADEAGAVVATWQTDHGVSEWLPRDQHVVRDALPLTGVPAGTYDLFLGVAQRSTDTRIALPLADTRPDGWYPVTTVSLRG